MGKTGKKRRRSSQKTPECLPPNKKTDIKDTVTNNIEITESTPTCSIIESNRQTETEPDNNLLLNINNTQSDKELTEQDHNMAERMEELSKIVSNAVEKLIEKYELNTIKVKLDKLADTASQISDIKVSIENSNDSLDDLKKQVAQKNEESKLLKDKVEYLETTLKREMEHRLKLETEMKTANLKFYGFPETHLKTTTQNSNAKTNEERELKLLITDFLDKAMDIHNIEIDTCYRIGYQSKVKTDSISRPILVKFLKRGDREKVWSNRTKLKGTNITIREDLPYETEGRMRKLAPVYHTAKSHNMKVSLNRDILRLNGKKFTVETMHMLPASLQPKNLAIKETEQCVLFWGKESYLSNFHNDSKFKIDQQVYTSVEQYYCAHKASFFNDDVAKQKIMSTSDPVIQKKTEIRGYNSKEWNLVADKFMEDALFAKFSQNDKLKEALLKTGNKVIGEANPYDSYWGIGLRSTDKRIDSRENWGQNKLGKLLGLIRDKLRQNT
jgi:hypothetical protein